MLQDRGLLDPGTRIAELIPGFETHDKRQITVLDVLTHRAGILLSQLVRDPGTWADRDAVLARLVEARPAYKRGTFAYMPYEFGWLLAEVVLRLDGRTMADFIAEELSELLALPGLALGLAGRDAASLAAFYEFLLAGGMTRAGRRLISEATLRQYTTCNFVGWERNSKALSAMGRGFMTGARFPTIYGWWNTARCFGHAGGLGCLAFGDHGTGLAAAIVTNGNRSFADLAKRFMPLAHGLRAACR
jgi:CubicO group peptidase (beta-lactamase class C family)